MARTNGWAAGGKLGAGLLLALLGLVSTPVRAADEGDRSSKIEQLFREGVDLYQQGRRAEAHSKFREVMSLEPRGEMATRLVEEAGHAVMAKLMADPRMGNYPTRIWLLYRQYFVRKLADKERMAKMALRVVDPATSDDERALLYREFTELSHYAVPSLAHHLKDEQHADFRTYARVVLARIGRPAILPLLELLNHKDVLMRENAILALTDIEPADERAIPALKARLEDPQETATAKRYATRALEKITGLKSDGLKSSARYYYESANRYYLERAGTAEEAEFVDGYIWHLNEAGELVPVEFPMWAWNEQMAEQQVLRGMKLQLDQTDFYPLAACIWAAQYMEVKDLLALVKEQPTKHFLSAEEQQQVEAWDRKLVDCNNLAGACGKWYVNEALFKVLRDMEKYPGHPKLPGVGVFLCRKLRDLDPKGDLLQGYQAPAPVAETLSPPVLTTIVVVPPKATVNPNESQQFTAIGKDQYGMIMRGITYTWSVDEGVGGSVDSTGLFTAGPNPGGPYTIYATAKDVPGAVPAPVPGSATAVAPAPAAPLAAKAVADVAAVSPPTPGDGPTQPMALGSVPGEGSVAASGSALIPAMDSPDQVLQYAAASALGTINRFPQSWAGSDKVAALLGRGVSENQPLQVLVAEENHNVRNEMRTRLEALGYGVTDASTGRDAMLKARSFPPKDIVLVSDRLRRDLTPEQLLEELRADVRTRYIPAGVLHDRLAQTATKARFGAEILLVEREMKDNDLKVAIEKLEAVRPPESVPKERAHLVAVECATVLSKIDPRATQLKLADAVPDCVKALVNRKDDVRNPCAIFVGRTEGGNIKEEAAAKLLAVFQDQANSDETTKPQGEMRLNALKALGMVKPEAYADVYLKTQTDRSHDIQEWAAYNFGKYVRTNKQLFEFLTTKRIDKDLKEK